MGQVVGSIVPLRPMQGPGRASELPQGEGKCVDFSLRDSAMINLGSSSINPAGFSSSSQILRGNTRNFSDPALCIQREKPIRPGRFQMRCMFSPFGVEFLFIANNSQFLGS